MECSPIENGSASDCPSGQRDRLGSNRNRTVMGNEDEPFAVGPPNGGVVSLTQARRRLYKRIEHRLQIECRTTDDLEYVSGGCLLLERLTEFVQQPRVLDSDDCLRSEILNQLDLLVGERP